MNGLEQLRAPGPAFGPVPNDPRPPRRVLVDVPDGPEGIRMVLAIMARLVRENCGDDSIRDTAQNIAGRNTDYYHQAERIHNWVRDNIGYERDPQEYELLAGPYQTMDIRQGDCKKKSVLEACLLMALNHPVQFVAVSLEPDNFSHVFVKTLVGDRWVASDTTEPQPFGWEPRDGVIARLIRKV